ncbi:MAG TPA: carboxypeptidase regulatory-like domain-containing protein, partial [Terriglobia bacterium]|nr:carboxypeptidase regulatory-like domain-containing protein [Terriglobia bacterium]
MAHEKIPFLSLLLIHTALLASLAGNLPAQTTISGYVWGTVIDPSKAVVRAAKVSLQNTATGLSLSGETNADGVFHFDFVPPGTYSLTVSAEGFTAWKAGNVEVTVGQSTTVNAQLGMSATATTVEVQVDSGAVETEDGNISTNYTEKEILTVPNPGGDLTYVAQTAPGAVMNTQSGGGNFSVFGLPGYSNVFTINGMDYLNSYADNNKSGATNNSLGANEMQSVTVVNNGYSGNYGRLVGAN